MVEHDDHRNRDQQIKDQSEHIAPGAEHPRHLLFMRRFRGGGDPGADPAGVMHDHRGESDDQHEHVKHKLEFTSKNGANNHVIANEPKW